MSELNTSARSITYGDLLAQAFLWQKAILLVPLWAVPLIPLAGFIFRSFGHYPGLFGYAAVLCLCVIYFLQDLLKRRIRFSDDHIFFGFRTIKINDIKAIDVAYKRGCVQPRALEISCGSGTRLALSLSGLQEEGISTLIKHLQSRNSGLQTGPVLTTIIKCHRVTRRSIIDTPDSLLLPYHSRKFLGETIDTFKASARKWVRMGPVITLLLTGPIWMAVLSLLYSALEPRSTRLLNEYEKQLPELVLSGLDSNLTKAFSSLSAAVQHVSDRKDVLWISSILLAVSACCFIKMLLRPNVVRADSLKLELALRLVGGLLISLRSIAWSSIQSAHLKTQKNSGVETQQLVLTSNNGGSFEVDLSALTSEHRFRLLQRIERMAPGCQIQHELSRSMQPKSDHSYTQIWLQSLTQAPERQTMEPLAPGQIVGDNRFEVLQQLGVGGQGTAYLCRDIHSSDNSAIVLKETILPTFVDPAVRRGALERFESEARLLRAVKSDSIVQLLDYFVEDHRGYLVLEYIDGLTLRELIAREGALPEDKVCDIANQMCKMLDALHTQSIVHRDFTPDNLILSSTGKLKLIDFNVAQQNPASATGTIVGKHAYVSPEQFRGKPTFQSDIYSMGATLFYLVTGTDPEPISQSSPAKAGIIVSESFDLLVRKATDLKVSDRFQSALEIESALHNHAEPKETSSLSTGSKIDLSQREVLHSG